MLKAKKLTKIYPTPKGAVKALEDVTFSIEEGEFVAIVGASGSGKSTLLMMLGGMLTPTSGELLIDQRSLYDLSIDELASFRRDQLGFVFQSFHLFPYLTALQNVQMPLLLKGKSALEQRECAESILEQLGIIDRKDHTPQELSIGQQQRVALARTLANDPKILLADEPTGNLDPKRCQEVMETFHLLHKANKTIIMVTHNLSQAKQAHRILTLHEGRLS